MLSGTREVKVGLFVFIAFVLLAVVVFSISDFYTTQAHYTYPLRTRFGYVNGVEVGAPVRISGVKVGEVRSVRVYRDEANQRTFAEVAVRISKDALVEEDAVVYINTLGFLGERYLEIIPGTPGARVLNPGEIIVGKDTVPTGQLVASSYRAIRKLETAIGNVNRIIGDEKMQKSLKGTLANSDKATAELHRFLIQANEVMAKIRNGEGTVGRLLTQDDLYEDIMDAVADIKAHPWKLFFRPKARRK